MWSKEKSVKLTHFMVRACYVLLAVFIAALIVLFKSYGYILLQEVYIMVKYAGVLLCALVPIGYTALICLDRLLMNIKKEIVFDKSNTKLLKIISWSCFGAAILCLIYIVLCCLIFTPITRNYTLFTIIFLSAVLLLASGAGFMGLVVRVVKNVFESAIKIKEENELTI
ncbi:MAG: DUF2975 domain-containing protein [Eubacterium sp.]|nr:DUF2975 domain-containing protein [Eubacterium sp.]